ncbi:CHAT domain-containing tetratricopeptide repeat protein [Aquimarina sp. Aq107]|uniref:CHAT domain-containing protein n=1 Tax=Aquimarina sp. Aq107 TaxID=1191912 RepID=UPI00131F442C|nr:CHAT domain-containing tetratricopeptide repeat protein [Aquimarina sp. Aq107]
MEKKADSSITYFKEALNIYRENKSWKQVASCYNKISENYGNSMKFDKSLDNIKKALHISSTYLEKDNPEKANAYDNQGVYFQGLSNYDEALIYFQKALDIRKKLFPENHLDLAISYSNLAMFNYRINKYKLALEYNEKAIAIRLRELGSDHIKIGFNYNVTGIIYSDLGKYEKALEYYNKFLNIVVKNFGDNHLYVGQVNLNAGLTSFRMMRYEYALKCYEKALTIYKNENFLNGQKILYLNTGIVFYQKGEYDKTLEYLRKSLNLGLKIHGEKHPHSGSIYRNMGRVCFYNEDYDQALKYYNKALILSKSIFGENHTSIQTVYLYMGDLYFKIKEYNRAIEYYKKSIEIGNSLFGKHRAIASAFEFIGNVYSEMKSYEEAQLYYQKGLNLLLNEFSEEHPITSDFYLAIAKVYHNQKKYKKAIKYFNKSLLANTKDKKTISKDGFDPGNFYDLQKILMTYYNKGKTLNAIFVKNKDLNYLNESLSIYDKIDIVIDRIRSTSNNYKDKVAFAKQTKEIYTDVINSQMLFYEETKNKERLLNAFYYSEKSKGNTLKQLLKDSYAKNSIVPSEIINLAENLKRKRAFYKGQIISSSLNNPIDTIRITENEIKLFDVNRKEDSLLKILEKNYPKYHQIKYKKEIISVANIQEKLNKNTTLIEFFTTDNDLIYAFVISKNTISVKELLLENPKKKVEEFHESITTKDLVKYQKYSSQLYFKLIKPFENDLVGDRLIIVPDGFLWHINFDLLLTQNDRSNDPEQFSYFLKDYAISYANSSNLLWTSFKNDINPDMLQEECLAFSYSESFFNSKDNIGAADILRDLPGTRKEIKEISKIVDGKYYYDSQSTEANFKKYAGKYGILHLALHGVIDNQNPENSKLFFTNNNNTEEDNLLYSHELMMLNIPSDLAVLSACNTGSGKIAKGEGIMSLGNAFQYAGTKSLLLTNWSVSDETTPKLMEYFYSNLKKGMSKDKALQNAKLKFLNTTTIDYKAPFYWGGFYLIGDSSPIPFKNSTLLYWIFGCGILSVLILLTIIKYNKKHNEL